MSFIMNPLIASLSVSLQAESEYLWFELMRNLGKSIKNKLNGLRVSIL